MPAIRKKRLLLFTALALAVASLPCGAYAAPQESWFDDAVFFGDSLSVGLADYAQSQRDAGTPCLGAARFLSELGYAVNDVAKPDGDASHPLYKNKRQNPLKSLEAMKPGKVFILLGVNDSFMEPEAVLSAYDAMLSSLRETLPEAKLIVQGLLPMIAAREDASYSNARFRRINDGLMALASSHGADYIALGAVLEKDGALDPDLSSDAYLHLNDKAYALYTAELERYAAFYASVSGPMQARTVVRQIVINGRAAPTRQARVRARIPGGVTLDVLSQSGAWYEARYEGESVYIHQSALLLEGALAATLSAPTPLYALPDEQSQALSQGGAGDTVHIAGGYYSPQWRRLCDQGQVAYVPSALVTAAP